MILDWIIVASKIKVDLGKYINDNNLRNKYVAIFLLWNDKPSEVYVWKKRKFWNDIWLDVKVFGHLWFKNTDSEIVNKINKIDILELDGLLKSIELLNKDEECIWIVIQLPLPKHLQEFKPAILAKISPLKDIDGLWWALMWISTIDYIDFLPGTPASVINLLKYYKLDNFDWKKVTIIGQSNLVWKPLVMEIIKNYWEVFSFNHRWNLEDIKNACRNSDYIITATWSVHMIDETYLREAWDQILIDVWYGILDGKAVWDINFEKVKDKVWAISPVPGWVWPLTVACLFNNIRVINEQKDKLKWIIW
jgi:methylenetetrahydrofolate dehydrogenase (NADP+) / methenyltetrahydrofolate cyclohydrolase